MPLAWLSCPVLSCSFCNSVIHRCNKIPFITFYQSRPLFIILISISLTRPTLSHGSINCVCAVLCYTTLCCAVLYCTVLCCAVLYCAVSTMDVTLIVTSAVRVHMILRQPYSDSNTVAEVNRSPDSIFNQWSWALHHNLKYSMVIKLRAGSAVSIPLITVKNWRDGDRNLPFCSRNGITFLIFAPHSLAYRIFPSLS